MKFGAHVSSRQPFSEASQRGHDIGCECIQIFANQPQRWNPLEIPPAEITKFKENMKKYDISPVIIHSIYLVNLAASNPFFYEASIKSLTDDMKKAEALGALGIAAHIGSTKGANLEDVVHKVVDAINKVLFETKETNFIIENSAGAGNVIGDTLEEIGGIIKLINSKRMKVIIDTAHAFESGYDIKSEEGLNNFINKFDMEIGLDRLVGFHFNDSKTVINSKRDRHADIGKGELGLEAFKQIIRHPKLKDKFAILETPQDETDWKEQLKLLRSL